ncbi:MAG: response regulator transcription factor [Anaerolineales bacterium]|jgi:DNA-binding NarL/FixJ family response regulator
MGTISGQKIKLYLTEDNASLQEALSVGLERAGNVEIIGQSDQGEKAVEDCLDRPPDAILMDVQLAGRMNGIEAAVAIRREHPRLPVVFYSIQDDDSYYRDFRRSGILSHYAYVRKSNHLLPEMIVRLIKDAVEGRSFIDPEIETRVEEVRHQDEHSPLELLEPNEQVVAEMLAEGLTNEQIANRLGFRDKRTVSRINGAIYTAWGLNMTTTDEKVARTRAAIIYLQKKLIVWDDDGLPRVTDRRGEWVPLDEVETN